MWPNLQKTVDLVTFTEEILNGKLHFLCSVILTCIAYQSELFIAGRLVFCSECETVLRLLEGGACLMPRAY